MNLEDQVVSLELAKKLKELGVIQPSIFGWIYHEHSETQAWACKHKELNACWYVIRGTNDHKPMLWSQDKEIAAFTVAELGEMLPQSIIYEEYELILGMAKGINDWITIYYEEEESAPIDCRDTTLANSMAKMLIYLIENGLLKVKE